MKLKNLFISIIVLLVSLGSVNAAIPTGYYYFAKGKKQAELKTILHQISSPLLVLDYGSGEGATWEGFYKTDRNLDNSVKDMYAPVVRQFNFFNSVGEMAIEHAFPKSWWGGYANLAYKDLFHLYPADSRTNSAKSNLPLGEVGSEVLYYNQMSSVGNNTFGTEYIGYAFEPSDEFKGDFARSYFYISTIYEDLYPHWDSPMLSKSLYPTWMPWAIDLLLKWHRQDPVSAKELDRNESVYAIQGNRNPFIDHPEIAEHIWGNKKEEPFSYPDEIDAFIISPRRKFRVDFGVVFQNLEKTQSILLQGVNINAPLNISFAKQNSCFSVSTKSISPSQVIKGLYLEIKALSLETGILTDTLIFSGGGLAESTKIPLSVISTSEFITTPPTEISPVGGVLHWIEDPKATDYKVSLYQGDTKAGNLIISGYYEGMSNNKAIELYNGTGATIDLSKYSLKKQTNGAGDFVVTQKLSGNLPNNHTYLIVYDPLSAAPPVDVALKSKADLFADSICAFNGNDAIALFRNGIQIDMIGKLNGGAAYHWGENKMLKRKSDITHPNNNFNLDDWDEFPYTMFEKMGTHTMTLPGVLKYVFKDKSADTINNMTVSGLEPGSKYTYNVISVRGGTEVSSVNTQNLQTLNLEAPVILDASEITATSFIANWESNPYVSDYLLDVFSLKGEISNEVEAFNTVTSTGGSLPEGWIGNISGNYTSVASSGNNPPSVGFKADKQWLKTKEFPEAISKLNFMYRFPSSGFGSYLIVEGQNQNGWSRIDSLAYVNTSKYYPHYTFTKNKAFTSIRFTFHKSAGNLSLDDVNVTYGQVDSMFVLENERVSSESISVIGLTENQNYFYRVRSVYQSSVSPYSDLAEVITVRTSTPSIEDRKFRISVTTDGIRISGIKGNENIRIYSMTGSLVYNTVSKTDNLSLPLLSKGLYILQISDEIHTENLKIVKH